jgi:5-methylcytosine-specific restriction endonuclease McrA
MTIIKCKVCGTERKLRSYSKIRDLCSKCVRKKQSGKNHPCWKGGYSLIKKQCIDCGKQVRYNIDRCDNCRKKYLEKNKINLYCIDCGKQLKTIWTKQTRKSPPDRCSCCANKGKNNPSYNEKLTDYEREHYRQFPGMYQWRIKILNRDNFTCQKCKIKDKHMHAHHIYSYKFYKKLRIKTSNGISLCEKCHIKYHSEYGKNSTKQKMDKFLNG